MTGNDSQMSKNRDDDFLSPGYNRPLRHIAPLGQGVTGARSADKKVPPFYVAADRFIIARKMVINSTREEGSERNGGK